MLRCVKYREIIVSNYNVIHFSKCCLLLELHFAVSVQISNTIFHNGTNNYVVYGVYFSLNINQCGKKQNFNITPVIGLRIPLKLSRKQNPS